MAVELAYALQASKEMEGLVYECEPISFPRGFVRMIKRRIDKSHYRRGQRMAQ